MGYDVRILEKKRRKDGYLRTSSKHGQAHPSLGCSMESVQVTGSRQHCRAPSSTYMPAEAFMPSETYNDYILHIPSGGGGTDVAARNRVQASVKQLTARFASRGDGLNDLTTTDAEYPLPQQPWISTVLNWPEVRTGWQARLDRARSIMGV